MSSIGCADQLTISDSHPFPIQVDKNAYMGTKPLKFEKDNPDTDTDIILESAFGDRLDFRSLSDKIPDLPLLSREESWTLIAQAQEGSRSAAEKLILHNLKLVPFVFHKEGFHLKEPLRKNYRNFFSDGVFGLVKAIYKFDFSYRAKGSDKPVVFSTFAYSYIRGYYLSAFKNFFIQTHMSESEYKRARELKKLIAKSDHPLSAEQVKAYFGWNHDTYLAVISGMSALKSTSLNESIGHEGDSTLEDTIESEAFDPPEAASQQEDLREFLEREVFSELEPQELLIIRSVFQIDGAESLDIDELCEATGLTRNKIRTTQANLMQKLKLILIEKNIDLEDLF